MEGFIQLHRKIMCWDWYDDLNTFKLFIHCLLKANHKDKTWRGVYIKRGSFITSTEKLSNETGLSIMQVRTSLKKLEKTNEVNKQTTSLNTCISMVNYNNYQGSNKPITNKQQTSNKQVTTTNNDNNDNNEKNNIIDFIYNLYPVRCPISRRSLNKGKKSKDKIEKLLNQYTLEEIQKRINLYIQDCNKTNTFYKAFDTFLNNIDTVITDEPVYVKKKYKIPL